MAHLSDSRVLPSSKISQWHAPTALLSLPNELLLLILHNVYSEDRGGDLEFPCMENFNPLPPTGEHIIRLEVFRYTAGTCRLFADLSRKIFWTKVTLSLENMRSFLTALDDGPDRAICIRQVRFILTGMSPQTAVAETLIAAILSRLRNVLDEFRIYCDRDDMGAFFGTVNQMQITHVRALVIWCKPVWNLCGFVGRFRNLTHLQLLISVLPKDLGKYSFELTNIQLHSLLLYVSIPVSYSLASVDASPLTGAARAVAAMLKPACATLRELTLIFRLPGRTPSIPFRDLFILVFRQLQCLGSPTISSLTIRSVRPIEHDFLSNLARHTVFENTLASFPSLKRLTVDNDHISPSILEKMMCWQLETLQVVLNVELPIGGDGERSVEEIVQNVVSSLKLPELTALRTVVVAALCYNHRDVDYPSWNNSRRQSMGKMLIPVREVCKARGIQYREVYSEFPR